MNNSRFQLIITHDGSHSIYLPDLNEHYHSIHGAIQESKHVFIDAGLKFMSNSSSIEETQGDLKILEVGLGTGLNCFLTFLENLNLNRSVFYEALEAFPLKEDTLMNLNYIKVLNAEENKLVFHKIHSSPWNEEFRLSARFKLKKINQEIQDVIFDQKFNLIYFDAFSPRVQPEIWGQEVFEKLYVVLEENGALVTYCAKGEVKRLLKNVGFIVESLKGPPGKREMIRAVK